MSIPTTRHIYTLIFLLTFSYFLLFPASPSLAPQKPFPTQPPSSTLLVTLYHPFKSKHPQAQYIEWLNSLLGTLQTHILIHTTPEFAPTIRKMRERAKAKAFITTSTDIWDGYMQQYRAKYEEMHSIDPEAHQHTAQLYATWNSKPELVRNATYTHPGYLAYFWIDAGSFRNMKHMKNVTEWPADDRLQRKRMFIPMWNAPEKSRQKKHKIGNGPFIAGGDKIDDLGDFIEGSCFGGSAEMMRWFATQFYDFHDFWLGKFFVGKDQNIYNSIVLLHPEQFWTLYPASEVEPKKDWRGRSDYDSVLCGSGWYYFVPWFAAEGYGTRQGDPKCPELAPLRMEEALTRSPFGQVAAQ